MIVKILLSLAVAATLSGCVARAAYDVGTAPIRAGSKVVDWSTTSRSEADRNRGRRVRKQCEKASKEARRRARAGETPAEPLPAFCR